MRFNYRLSRARSKVECAFGILAAQFLFYKRVMNLHTKNLTKLVQASVVLHNFLTKCTTKRQANAEVRHLNAGIDPDLDGPAVFRPLRKMGYNPTTEAAKVRDIYCEYFSKAGAVAWQDRLLGLSQ